MPDKKDPVIDEPAQPPADDDVEGHNLSIAMGLDRLTRPDGKTEARKQRQDDLLPRLTKPFPRMRDQKRG
jgi:hypothetical protein